MYFSLTTFLLAARACLDENGGPIASCSYGSISDWDTRYVTRFQTLLNHVNYHELKVDISCWNISSSNPHDGWSYFNGFILKRHVLILTLLDAQKVVARNNVHVLLG